MRRISETVQHSTFQGGAEDAYGNPIDGWADPVDLGIYAFNPGTTTEPFLPGHDRVITQPAMYVPEGAHINSRDRITVRGDVYEVDGVVLDYRNPYDSSMDGIQVNLKAVTG